MARGGARNNSGPAPDPKSGRSDRRGLSFTALPNEGYRGDAPEFPIPDPTARHLDLWRRVWRTPQAAAWAVQPWRWYAVAQWVRDAVKCESEDASAADKAAEMRRAEAIGLNDLAMAKMGWSIAQPEIASADEDERPESKSTGRARDRLRSVSGGG